MLLQVISGRNVHENSVQFLHLLVNLKLFQNEKLKDKTRKLRREQEIAAVASGPGPPLCPFPLGVEGWPRPSPGSPCPRLGALGPPIPLALTDSARVRALINQRQARHGNKDGFLPRPRRLHIPLSPADSDGKKTAHAAHKRDETKMKRIEGAKRRGIFPLKHSNKYPAMII